MARTKQSERQQENRLDRALFPRRLETSKMFQCRFDGCTKSYNHATSLNKHKKLYHGVAQNGRKLSAEEYQKFVAQVSAGRCRIVLKKSTKETNKSVDTAMKNRVPMKTSKPSASIGKQPRKSWSPIVSDVSSEESDQSDQDVLHTSKGVTEKSVENSDLRTLSKGKIIHTEIGSAVTRDEDVNDNDTTSISESSSSSSDDEQLVVENDRPKMHPSIQSTSTMMSIANVTDDRLLEQRSIGEISVESTIDRNAVNAVLSTELSTFVSGELNISSDLLGNIGTDDIEMLMDVNSLAMLNQSTAVPSLIVPNVATAAIRAVDGCSSVSSCSTIPTSRPVVSSVSAVSNLGNSKATAIMPPMSVLQLHEITRLMPTSSAFEMAAEIQRLMSLSDEQTDRIRFQLSAMLFSRQRAFEDVYRLLPTYGASDSDVRLALQRISALITEAESRPRFRLFEL
jgi:hypothetical protein